MDGIVEKDKAYVHQKDGSPMSRNVGSGLVTYKGVVVGVCRWMV